MPSSLATLRHKIKSASSVSQIADLYAEVVDLNTGNAYAEDHLLTVLDLVNNRLIQILDPDWSIPLRRSKSKLG